MITFDSQAAFEDAVMAVLKERLSVSVHVDMVLDGDYHNPSRVPEVTVDIKDEDGHGLIARGSGKSW